MRFTNRPYWAGYFEGYSAITEHSPEAETDALAFLVEDFAKEYRRVGGKWELRASRYVNGHWHSIAVNEGDRIEVDYSKLPGRHAFTLASRKQPSTSMLYRAEDSNNLVFTASPARVAFAFGEYMEHTLDFNYTPRGRIMVLEKMMGASFEKREAIIRMDSMFGSGVAAVTRLNEHKVPLEYALAAGPTTALGEIIECYKAGIPVEYLEALGG